MKQRHLLKIMLMKLKNKKDFCVERHHKRNCKRKKKIASVEQETVEKNQEKKLKLMADLEEN